MTAVELYQKAAEMLRMMPHGERCFCCGGPWNNHIEHGLGPCYWETFCKTIDEAICVSRDLADIENQIQGLIPVVEAAHLAARKCARLSTDEVE